MINFVVICCNVVVRLMLGDCLILIRFVIWLIMIRMFILVLYLIIIVWEIKCVRFFSLKKFVVICMMLMINLMISIFCSGVSGMFVIIINVFVMMMEIVLVGLKIMWCELLKIV